MFWFQGGTWALYQFAQETLFGFAQFQMTWQKYTWYRLGKHVNTEHLNK